MLNSSASLAMSTSVLKASPGKLDIKRHSPSILYLHGKHLVNLRCIDKGEGIVVLKQLTANMMLITTTTMFTQMSMAIIMYSLIELLCVVVKRKKSCLKNLFRELECTYFDTAIY